MKSLTYFFTIAIFSTVFIYPSATLARGTDSCGGYTSTGNPFDCCTHKDKTAGNCTWWAWKQAKDNWGESPVSSGSPSSWVSNSKANKIFAVSTDVQNPSIAVSSAHVAWVTGSYDKCLSKDKKGKCTKYEKRITGTEMNCPDQYKAQGTFDYKASSYQYIYKK